MHFPLETRVEVLVLTQTEYLWLQQVFADHFVRRERYLECLTDALLAVAEPPSSSDHPERHMIQLTAPDYLFQKRGLARDQVLSQTIHESLTFRRVVTLSPSEFCHLLILVVEAFCHSQSKVYRLSQKMDAILERALSLQNPVALRLVDEPSEYTLPNKVSNADPR